MNNRVVLVTGAGNGIGAEVAFAFAAKGDKVIVSDINQEHAERSQKQIVEAGGEACAYTCDVSNVEQVIHMMEWIDETYGRIDVCINNAGISKWISPLELSIEEWDKVLNTNARGTFVCSREATKYMKKHQTGGSIINMASTRAQMSEPNSEAYAASKGAIVSLTHALAASLQEDGIQVNSISPGWIHTGDTQELRSIDHSQHFSKRVGEPADIARACLFLSDPQNTFITGENLTIDGGMTRKMIYEH
ncbi:NAD(P)-dependent dehydrogenase (short-subunit alcohol dehydrogenase family) [Alkalicoccobacillus murimartini]|uniref:NAD(P)-dependent dehydrogenase (Short-subunit alcohol dehydrogenase family) n=2 Tax=Alkalicoccobacillus murimartini TaxID=171685 RepID=A0ABT9YD59_9BACI|nr:NAD(P)-dependent dehydrogenase (short-subunit alcohol dehydrogenase family) [Alkalicoccobacillus murimartini]